VYVEIFTDRLEAAAEAYFARIRDLGPDGTMTTGILRGIEEWLVPGGDRRGGVPVQPEKLEKGDKKVVGVNVHTSTVEERWRSCASAMRGTGSARDVGRSAQRRDQSGPSTQR